MDLNILGNYPTFFIDSTTHQGLSGAPVYVLTNERTVWRQGATISTMGWPSANVFLGIYSGRAWDGSNLGHVWKAEAVDDVVRRGIAAEFPERDDG